MSRGRSGDKTYKRDVPSAYMDVLQRLDDHPRQTSIQDRLIAPSPEEMRRALANGECPFCGRSFQNIAVHTNRSHGVGRDELKDMALIPRSHSVCTPELSATFAEAARQRFADDPVAGARRLTPKKVPRTVSPGGRARLRDISIGGQIIQRLKATAQTPEQRAKAAATLQRRYYARTAARDEAIAARARDGATLAELVDEFGVGAQAIRNACTRQGVKVNWRSVMMRRPENHGHRLTAMHDGRSRANEQHRLAKIARWQELGANWEAARLLAAEYGETEIAIRQFLRNNNQPLPDGRQVSARRYSSPHGRGVRPNGSGFSAQVTFRGTLHHLGTFRTPEQAAAAAPATRVELGIEDA